MGFGTARILTNLILKILEILEIVEGGIIVFHYLFFMSLWDLKSDEIEQFSRKCGEIK